ncbi:MAG: hypothetical protein J5843_04255 [Clostridia bacterium]|nr:hypothetical protein [Clostridia bacterium]
MDIRKITELALELYESRLWDLLDIDDLVAVDLGDETGYVRLLRVPGGNATLMVFPGAEALSTWRETVAGIDLENTSGKMRLERLDMIQCDFIKHSKMVAPLRKELRQKAADLGIKFTDPLPVFSRRYPYVLSLGNFGEEDFRAMALVLNVLLKLSAALESGHKTKKELGIRTIFTHKNVNILESDSGSGEFYPSGFDKEVLIPVFKDAPKGFRVQMEPLPPYVEHTYNPPTSFTDPVFTRLLEHKKRGEYDVDLIHFPKLHEGDPPFYPESFIFIDRANPQHVTSYSYPGPFIVDTDAFLVNIVRKMLEEGECPGLIRYRSPAVKTILKPLCDRVGIKTRKVTYLDNVDFFLNEFDRFDVHEVEPSKQDTEKKEPAPVKNKPNKKKSAAEIARLELAPVYKLAQLPDEELENLLTYQHNKLSAGLIRKIYRALSY